MSRHSFLRSNKTVTVHNTDVSDRDKVLDQLRGFFGFENVVPISTYNVLKLKSLIKDLSKFYSVPFEEANAATRTVEDDVRKAVTKHGDDKNLFVLKYEDAIGYLCEDKEKNKESPICSGCTEKCTKPVSPSFKSFLDKHPEITESIQVLFKQNRSLGRHAGGVLIADDLPNKMPLITSGGEPQAPWQEGVAIKHLEYIGNFIKYDLLGLETMRLIERTIELILKKEGCYEIDVDGTTVKLAGNQSVKLVDGSWCSVSKLTSEHDVFVPIEVQG